MRNLVLAIFLAIGFIGCGSSTPISNSNHLNNQISIQLVNYDKNGREFARVINQTDSISSNYINQDIEKRLKTLEKREPKIIYKEKIIEKPVEVEKVIYKEKIVKVVDNSKILELEKELAKLKAEKTQKPVPKMVFVEKVIKVEKPKQSYSTSNTWRDPDTGLVWQNQHFTKEDKKHYDNRTEGHRVWKWKNVIKYCENLVLDGKSDWRLPTRKELKTLLTNKRNGWLYIKQPMVKNTEILKGGKYNYFSVWSITEYNKNGSYSWNVNFKNGHDYWNGETNGHYVVCVEDFM